MEFSDRYYAEFQELDGAKTIEVVVDPDDDAVPGSRDELGHRA